MDLDRPETLCRARAGCTRCCTARRRRPPALTDTRTANLLAALENGRILPTRLVYISTSGVYGDCGGARVDESRAVQPAEPRARRRRADAEAQPCTMVQSARRALVVLRAPGIYAADRLPLERLRAGTPVLRDADDVYTNHIHADDLAAICVRALDDAAPAGTYNASDDSELKMGDMVRPGRRSRRAAAPAAHRACAKPPAACRRSCCPS